MLYHHKFLLELRDKMIETAKQSPYYEIINSFYGIGEILTAEILGELGLTISYIYFYN